MGNVFLVRCDATITGAPDATSWALAFGTSGTTSNLSLLVGRSTLALMFGVFFVYYIIRFWQGGYWLIYLTHWSLTVETVYVIGLVIVTCQAQKVLPNTDSASTYLASESDTGPMPTIAKVTLELFMIAQPASFMIFALYWTLDNPIWKLTSASLAALDWTTYVVHGLNFVLLFIELFFSRVPFLLRNSLPHFIYCLLYVSWTYIQFLLKIGTGVPCTQYSNPGQCPIYTVLDWHDPQSATVVAIGVTFVALPTTLGIYMAFNKCRLWIDKAVAQIDASYAAAMGVKVNPSVP